MKSATKACNVHTSVSVPDCYIQLLTAGYWPTSPSIETLNLPLELIQLQEKYTEFYCAKWVSYICTPYCLLSIPLPHSITFSLSLSLSLLLSLLLSLILTLYLSLTLSLSLSLHINRTVCNALSLSFTHWLTHWLIIWMIDWLTDYLIFLFRYQGRRLQWAHAHQRCVLTARFPKGKKELEVSLFQVRRQKWAREEKGRTMADVWENEIISR